MGANTEPFHQTAGCRLLARIYLFLEIFRKNEVIFRKILMSDSLPNQ